jgi:hypothetical protein
VSKQHSILRQLVPFGEVMPEIAALGARPTSPVLLHATAQSLVDGGLVVVVLRCIEEIWVEGKGEMVPCASRKG